MKEARWAAAVRRGQQYGARAVLMQPAARPAGWLAHRQWPPRPMRQPPSSAGAWASCPFPPLLGCAAACQVLSHCSLAHSGSTRAQSAFCWAMRGRLAPRRHPAVGSPADCRQPPLRRPEKPWRAGKERERGRERKRERERESVREVEWASSRLPRRRRTRE
eukprot:scaffold118715_cov31-Tisochrysis_lutea.AAC.7